MSDTAQGHPFSYTVVQPTAPPRPPPAPEPFSYTVVPAQTAAPAPAQVPAPVTPEPSPAATRSPIMPPVPEPVVDPLSAYIVPTPVPTAPVDEGSGFFSGLVSGGQAAVREGVQTLQGNAFTIDPNAPVEPQARGWFNELGFGLGHSFPTLAAGLGGGAAGAAVGSAVPGVGTAVGSLAGAALGVGGASLVQDLAPVYAQQIQAGKTHDEAVDYAWKHGAATGLISGATAYIPGPVKSVLGHILWQSFVGQPVSGAAVRGGVPLALGEPLPTAGEFVRGAGQDIAAGAGFAAAHAIGGRAVNVARNVARPPPGEAPPEGGPTRTEIAPGQEEIIAPSPPPAVNTAGFGPAPTRIDVTPTGPEGVRPSEPVPAAAAPAPPAVEAPATREGPPPSAPAVASAPRLPAEELPPARSAASEAEAGQPGAVVEPSRLPPWVVENNRQAVELANRLGITEQVREMATSGQTAAEISQALGGRLTVDQVRAVRDNLGVEPAGPLGTSFGPNIPRGEPVDRPGAAPGRPGEPAPVGEGGPRPVVPGPGEVPGRPGVGADPGERPGDTQAARAGEQPAAQPALPAGEARPEVGAEPPVRATPEAPATEAAPVTPGPAAEGIPFVMTAAMKRELAGLGHTPEQIRNMTPGQAHEILRAARAEAPATEAPPVGRLTTEPDHTVPGQHVAKNEAGEVVGKGPTPEAATTDAQARQSAPYPETAAPVTREAPARVPEEYRKLDPDIPATEYVRRLAELRDNKPRPINKLWRNPETAPPEQVAAAREALRAWNQEYRQVARAQKLAEARDNEAYQARQEAPAPLEDQAVVLPEADRAPGPREEAGTTGPRETADLTQTLRDNTPSFPADPTLTKLQATRDALEAKIPKTLPDRLKLSQVKTQIEKRERTLEERRGGVKQPYSGPPEVGRPRDFLDYKFNDGTSVFRSVFEETGHDPDNVATNWTIQRQNEVLTQHMQSKFGFTNVEVVGARGKDATPVEHKLARDAMLDMTRALQDGMATMDQPLSAASLHGKLKLVIEPPGSRKYYGAYVPAEGELRVVAGANSFGHEWTHAIDHGLAQWATGNSAQMSKLFSQYTRDGNLDPTISSHAAFAKVINTMFYDQGALAMHQINLEIASQKTDRAGNPTKAALDAQRQLDLLNKGASQQRIQPSEFRLKSAQINPKDASYWTNAWEMLARSHEAYMAWKMELEGKDPRGFVMPDEAYINETARQLRLAYPKDDGGQNGDRSRIFEAWGQLHEAWLKEQLLTQGKPPGEFSNFGRSDPHYKDTTAPGFAKTKLGRAWEEEKRKYSNLSRSVHATSLYDETRPVGPTSLGTRFKDGFKVLTYSIHGIMETLIERAPEAAKGRLTALMDLVAAAPGEGRYTGEHFEEAVRNRSRGWMNQYANILKSGGLDPEHTTPEQDAMLRHVMVTGETRMDGQAIPRDIVRTAGNLRFLMDKMWDASRKAGMDVGYSSRYFPRLYDMAKFFSDPEGFRQAAHKMYAFMFDRDIGAPGSSTQAFLEKWTTLSRPEKALAPQSLETEMAALNKNLARQREIEGLSAPTRTEQTELARLQGEAQQLAADNHDALRDHIAAIAADHWHARLAKGNHADYDTVGPSGRYLNARVLPPEADVIMKDFMHTDTRDAIPNYIHAVARKVSYAERFGAKGEALDAAFEELRKIPGVNHEDMQYFHSLIEQVTGRNNNKGAFFNRMQSINNVLHALGQVALMPRAVWSQLAEPMNIALATGSVKAGLKTFAYQMGHFWDRASALERTELANFLNVTQSSMMDSIILSRMSADYSNSPLLNKLLTMYYKVTGLTQMTNSQRTAAAASANWFLAKLSRDLQDQGTGTRQAHARDDATRWFNELGLPPRLHDEFAQWMTDLKGDLPSVERLQTDPMTSAYGLAIRRLADRFIQDPYKVDRAAISSTPIIGLAVQLMSFNYQFQRNVLNVVWSRIEHSYGRAKLEAEAAGAGRVGAAAKGLTMAGGTAAHAAAMAATMIGAGLMTTAVRQLLFAPDQWKKHEEDGDLEDYLLNLTFQRSGLNGTLDPIIQLFSNLRYNADLTSIMGGATPNWIFRNGQEVIQPFVSTNDSPNTNTRLFNQARGAFNLIGVPLMATGLTMAGNIGGPVSKAIAGGLLQYGTSPGAANEFAEFAVGSPKGAERAKPESDELPGIGLDKENLPGISLDAKDAGAEGGAGGGVIPWGLVDDIAVPAWRYGAPVISGLPRSVKAGAGVVGTLYGGSKYLEATEPFRGQPGPPPKKSAQQ